MLHWTYARLTQFGVLVIPTQQTHNIELMSSWRFCDVVCPLCRFILKFYIILIYSIYFFFYMKCNCLPFHMHILDYILNLYHKEDKVKTVFHHKANDCEMRRVLFPNVWKPFGVVEINFTVINTMVKIMHTGEKPIVCIQRLYCKPEDI